jgi:hypothetical protein
VQSFCPQNTASTRRTRFVRSEIVASWDRGCVTRDGMVRASRTRRAWPDADVAGELAESERVRPRPGRPLRNDAVSDGVEYQFRRVVQIEFLQNVGSMRFHRSRTHAQEFSDFLVAVTFGNQLEDLPLAL